MSGRMDKFELLYTRQIAFQQIVEGKLPSDNPTKFQYHMNAMTEEMGEVLKADKRWKTHRNTTYVPEEKLDEIADMFITTLNISMWSGFTAEQLYEAVTKKIEENIQRMKG